MATVSLKKSQNGSESLILYVTLWLLTSGHFVALGCYQGAAALAANPASQKGLHISLGAGDARVLEGHSFIVGAAVSIGGRDIKPGINVHRFANRIPLLFEVRQRTAKLLVAAQSVHSLLPACTNSNLTHFPSSAPNLVPPGDSS